MSTDGRGDSVGRRAERRARRFITAIMARRPERKLIEIAYRGVFERPPDPEGIRHWRQSRRSGSTREELLRGLIDSTEAGRRAIYSPGIRSFVEEFLHLRAKVDPDLRPVCFLHAMKTGGTALRAALVNLTGWWPILTDLMVDHLVCLPPPLLTHAMLVTGHLPYEAVEFLPEGVALCTVVRDPIERTLSHHGHVHEMLLSRGTEGVSLTDFVTAPHFRPLWENYQSRQLVHRIGLSDAFRTFAPRDRAASQGIGGDDLEFPLQSLFDSAPLSIEPGALLETALARLETFAFVGVADDLDRLAGRVAQFWRRPGQTSVPRVRVGELRGRTDEVPSELMATIKEHTAIDAALYDRALQMNDAPIGS